jgi:hypothetical protein
MTAPVAVGIFVVAPASSPLSAFLGWKPLSWVSEPL